MSAIDQEPRLAAPKIYEVIAREGLEELYRPFTALMWSAFVAGICISFCLFCEAFIKINVPQNSNYFLFENLGYTVGFIIVIIGRFQLFTENTITVILPLLDKTTPNRFQLTARIWGIVMFFNFLGTFVVALMTTYLPIFTPEQVTAFLDISDHAINKELHLIFFQAIPAGFLIAALVWIMPSIEGSKFWIIMLITYVIAIGDFAHVIAGSGEAFLLMINGQTTIAHGLGYLVAAALGNILGGTGLFAFMAYAQVKVEIEEESEIK